MDVLLMKKRVPQNQNVSMPSPFNVSRNIRLAIKFSLVFLKNNVIAHINHLLPVQPKGKE